MTTQPVQMVVVPMEYQGNTSNKHIDEYQFCSFSGIFSCAGIVHIILGFCLLVFTIQLISFIITAVKGDNAEFEYMVILVIIELVITCTCFIIYRKKKMYLRDFSSGCCYIYCFCMALIIGLIIASIIYGATTPDEPEDTTGNTTTNNTDDNDGSNDQTMGSLVWVFILLFICWPCFLCILMGAM